MHFDVKKKQRALYGDGDYSALAAVLEPAAIALVDAVLAKERPASATDPDQDFFNEVEGRRLRERPDYPEEPRKRRRRSFLEDLLDFD